MSGDLVRYSSFDFDMIEDLDRQIDDIVQTVYVSLAVGDTTIRILPGFVGASPFRPVAMHFIDALPGMADKTISFACPRVELQEFCLACQKAQQLMSTKNPVDKQRAKRISTTLQVLCNVVVRPSTTPKVLPIGMTVWKQLKAIKNNPKLGGDFTDPTEGGYDLVINREGTGQYDTKYKVFYERENTPLAPTPQEIDAILANRHDLEALVDPTVPTEILEAWRNLARAGSGSAQQSSAYSTDDRQRRARSSAVIDAVGETVEEDEDDPSTWG